MSTFHYDLDGQAFKIYSSIPLRWSGYKGKEDNMGIKNFQTAGQELHEMTVALMEDTGEESYEVAFQETLNANPELKEQYAAPSITVKPSVPQTPYLKRVGDEVHKRTLAYIKDHNLSPSDYVMALQAVLDDDERLRDAYHAGGFQPWEN